MSVKEEELGDGTSRGNRLKKKKNNAHPKGHNKEGSKLTHGGDSGGLVQGMCG